jgi:hypothetical protein
MKKPERRTLRDIHRWKTSIPERLRFDYAVEEGTFYRMADCGRRYPTGKDRQTDRHLEADLTRLRRPAAAEIELDLTGEGRGTDSGRTT